MTTETAAATTAVISLFLGMQGDALKAYMDRDLAVKDLGENATIFTTAAELADANDVPLAAIVVAYNKVAAKKVRGFKDRKEASAALFDVLTNLAAKQAQAEGQTEAEKLAAAVKPAKEKKAPKAKAEGTGEGRSSPLAKKFWSRSGAALNGRRIGGSGVGIQALQYIINNPGCSTEDYIANSGGGRFVDLQYDLDKGNIVALKGATPEERQAEIEELSKAREGAEKAEAERLAKVEADKKAKAEAAEKAKKDKAEKAAADKKAKEDAAAAAAAKPEGEQTATGEQAPAENA